MLTLVSVDAHLYNSGFSDVSHRFSGINPLLSGFMLKYSFMTVKCLIKHNKSPVHFYMYLFSSRGGVKIYLTSSHSFLFDVIHG